jgi:hypothetical protein
MLSAAVVAAGLRYRTPWTSRTLTAMPSVASFPSTTLRTRAGVRVACTLEQRVRRQILSH